MGTDLEHAANSTGVVRAQGGPTDPGAGHTLDDATFENRGYTFDADMPTAFREGAAQSTALALQKQGGTASSALMRASDTAPLKSDRELAQIASQTIASGTRQLDKPRRTIDGRIVQRRIGWRATPLLIIISTAERELAKGTDGRLRPAGEWLLEHRKTYRNAGGAAKKRTGQVPLEEETQRTKGPSIPGAPNANADDFTEGEFALSFLPPSVRSSARARVPNPTLFDGTLLQYATGDVLDRHEVNLIRMDEDHAVVIQAIRTPNAAHWDISQAAYTLQAPEIEQA